MHCRKLQLSVQWISLTIQINCVFMYIRELLYVPYLCKTVLSLNKALPMTIIFKIKDSS